MSDIMRGDEMEETRDRDQRVRRRRKQASELAAPAGSAFLHAKLTDATVAKMLRAGCGAEEIIGQLAADKEQYMKRIMELESIAPRKIVLPDGRVMVWQCPIELVPPMNTPNDQALPHGGAEMTPNANRD